MIKNDNSTIVVVLLMMVATLAMIAYLWSLF